MTDASAEDIIADAVKRMRRTGNGGGLTSVPVEEWPPSLGDDALHGIAGEIVRAIEPNTEADVVAILLQFLAAFGNICDRRAYVRVEGDRHPGQVWPVLVGRTAKGRKGTSWGRVRELMVGVDSAWADGKIIGGLSTGEGIMYAVRDAVPAKDKDGEGDPGVADKRLLVIESEFANPLRHMERPGNILSPTLRSLWDSGSAASLTKHSPTKTTRSMITVIGHVTEEELRRYLTKTELANGLANRFLFAMVRRSKELPFGGDDIDYEPFIHRLKEAVARAWSDQRIGWTKEAADIWRAAYGALSAGKGGLVGAVTSRAEAQVLRLALIYALLDGAAKLDAVHVKAGLAMWRYCEQSAGIIFGSATGNPVTDAILQRLKAAAEGLSRTDVNNIFDRHQSSQTIAYALDELVKADLAAPRMQPTAGRPMERWYAV